MSRPPHHVLILERVWGLRVEEFGEGWWGGIAAELGRRGADGTRGGVMWERERDSVVNAILVRTLATPPCLLPF
jgi:hypothetical protein